MNYSPYPIFTFLHDKKNNKKPCLQRALHSIENLPGQRGTVTFIHSTGDTVNISPCIIIYMNTFVELVFHLSFHLASERLICFDSIICRAKALIL